MSQLKTQLPTDIWIVATWDEYIQTITNPAYKKARAYYHDGQLRIEMTPIGPDHSRNSTIVIFAVNLFCTIKSIPLNGLDNCSYRKANVGECQPDISYYIGERAELAPQGTSIVDLDRNPPPDLAIEIANTSSLADDLGQKRLLYEEIGIAEYWVVDVQNRRIVAFTIANSGSRRINQSQVLLGLAFILLEEALRRSYQMDQAQVGSWLLAEMQK